jgi:hypothetical protein
VAIYLKNIRIQHTRTGRELRFTERVNEHLPTIKRNERMELYDTETPTGTVVPGVRRFFGYVSKIEPQGNEVHYTCVDPIGKLHQMMIADPSGLPRLVFNVPYQDPDYVYVLLNTFRESEPGTPANHNVSELWRVMLEIHEEAIHAECPGLSAGPPWTALPTGHIEDHYAPDTLIEDYGFEPDRVIFEEQTLGSAFDDLLQLVPSAELHFDPESKLLRWLARANLGVSGTGTVEDSTRTLNSIEDPSPSYQRPILAKEIGTSLEDRFTRVEIVGEPEDQIETATKSGGGLVELWDTGLEATWTIQRARSGGAGANNAYWYVHRQFKLTTGDERKRRILAWSRKGFFVQGVPGQPSEGFVDPGYTTKYYTAVLQRQHTPVLAAHFSINGDSGWFIVPCTYDQINGIILATNPLVLGDIRTSDTEFVKPDDVAFTYAWPDVPVLASYPEAAATFEGTASEAPYNIQRTASFFEDDLFDTEQQVNYRKLAKSLWRTRGDVIFTGSVVLHGIDYSFEGFNDDRNEHYGRLNIAGLKDDGTSETTGWEEMDAPVHDIDYDYEANTTTVTFNDDWAEYVFGDYETLKLRVQEAARRQPIVIPGGLVGGRVPGRDIKYGGFATSEFVLGLLTGNKDTQ